jgi:DNA topoisomerase-1
MIRKGKYGRFIACDKYPECKTTFKLPSSGLVKTTENLCKECKHPMIMMIRKAKKPQETCINPDCPSKQIKSEKENTSCPKCGKGKMVIRKSIYGQFLACDNFPKCRNIVKG